MKNTTETLDQWLTSQIKRGCTLESMIASMQEGGYTLAIAQNHVVAAFIAAGKLNGPYQATMPHQSSSYLSTAHLKQESPSQKIVLNNNTALSLSAQEKQAQLAWQAVINKRDMLASLAPVIQLDNPRVMVFEHFLSEDECDTLIALSQNKMLDSRVLDPASGEFVLHAERTSRGTHFEHQSNQVVTDIENRINTLFGFCVAQQEAMQILHYAVGGEYKPHYDFFPPSEAGSEGAIKAAGQRLATLIMYLNTPEQGGGTSLPNVGLTVTAKKGNAIYFENIDPLGQPNPQSLHAGMPVLAGEKWIATKWFRERSLF